MKLTDEQLKATMHLQGPALVLAVPGAGKTTMLLYRTVELIKKGIDPKRILSITFSKAASKDMAKRFSTLFPQHNLNLKFSTIHSFCYSIILDYGKIKRVHYDLIEGNNSRYKKSDILSNLYYKTNKSSISPEKLETLYSQIGYCKNALITPQEYIDAFKSEIDNFPTIFNAYESFKNSHNLIDFDDMITKGIEILKENPYLRSKYRKRYDFIQVDEGQDTSKGQLMLIKSLAKPHNNLFIVADDDQSIYGFRGAYPRGLLNLKEEYSDLVIYYLQENFRSTKNIVDTCNIFIQKNKDRYDKKLETCKDFGKPINIVKVRNTISQYDFINNEINKSPNSSHAILYRNNLSTIGLIEYFERKGFEFNIRDNKTKFFSHWVVRDILDILYFSKEQGNVSTFQKIYYKIKGYTSKKHINYLRTNSIYDNVFKNLLQYPGINNYYQKNFRELMLDFGKLEKMNVKDAIEYIQYDMQYDDYLKNFSKKFGHVYKNMNMYTNYLKFIATSADSLEEFKGRLKYLEHLLRKGIITPSNLNLSTIHGSKGLEFDKVFIVDLVEGIIPSASSIEESEKNNSLLLEEERRILYVAMTRAKSELYLLYPQYLFEEHNKESRFLEEIINIK